LTGPAPSPIAVNYEVILNSSDATYTYVYSFTAFAGDPATQLSINASYANPLAYESSLTSLGLPAGFGATVTGSYDSFASSPGTIIWDFRSAGQPTLETVAFTSLYGPINGTGSINDGNSGPWGDNPGSPEGATPLPVPAPVPEASTVMAGALMLLPFGIGAMRSLRRERTV
jgi:hypothetical protein